MDSMELRRAEPSAQDPDPEKWHCLQMAFTMAGFFRAFR
jgi:hypothetical protein